MAKHTAVPVMVGIQFYVQVIYKVVQRREFSIGRGRVINSGPITLR